MTETEMKHLERVTNICVNRGMTIEEQEARIAELEAANQQLTEYAARVKDLTIATERQRMARELHDTLS